MDGSGHYITGACFIDFGILMSSSLQIGEAIWSWETTIFVSPFPIKRDAHLVPHA